MTEPQAARTGPARGPGGRFRSSTATAARDRLAAELWAAGQSYREIGQHPDVGLSSKSAVKDAVERGLAEVRRPDAEVLDAAKARLVESRRVAAEMEAEARAVIAGRHLAFNQKGLIYDPADPEGKRVLVDSGPKLAAIDRVLAARKLMLALDEREAKLLGLDAEEKIAVSGGVIYEIVGVDPADIIGP
jgi:hypothetical protein